MSPERLSAFKQYLFISDFDQTLSFHDSGIVLSEMLGISGFHERITGLSNIHLVQQGGELAYLLLHDPEYRRVRRSDLMEAGKRIRLKQNIRLLSRMLDDLDGHRFSFYVVSAAPEEVIQSALEGIVPPDHIFGRRMEVLTLAVIAQLYARGNLHRIAREWFYGDDPETELGRQEADFWTRTPA